MKKLIIGMIATIIAITGYSATDAELKAMLDAKEYTSFVSNVKANQLTNLVTNTDAQNVYEAALSTNKQWFAILLCRSNKIEWQKAVDIAIEKKHPSAFLVAKQSKNDDLIVYAWEKVLDIPAIHIEDVYYYVVDLPKLKMSKLALSQKTAEIILDKIPMYYTRFVFGHANTAESTNEYKSWAASCLKNVNEKTCCFHGWLSLMNFDKSLRQSEKYYFANIWNREKAPRAKTVYAILRGTPYYNNAIEVLASSVTDSETAFEFANIVDKYAKNKEMTKRLYPIISKDIHYAVKVAIELNDIDKIIDIALNAGENLTADELNLMIPMINSLEADYRASEIVTALRNINSRYTLRLYNERETWEPVLSKIRAMIDVRQM